MGQARDPTTTTTTKYTCQTNNKSLQQVVLSSLSFHDIAFKGSASLLFPLVVPTFPLGGGNDVDDGGGGGGGGSPPPDEGVVAK
jgi:hypothetical protein